MSSYEPENFEGDWDDRGDVAWNEFDWQRYLHENGREVGRFIAVYERLKDRPNHLDEIACLMGWETEDWLALDETEGEEREAWPFEGEEESAMADDLDDIDPYTFHRHPVFVVTRGLCHCLRQAWEDWLAQPGTVTVHPQAAWHYAGAIHHCEMNAVMAVQALDLGDSALAVAQFKHALQGLNHALELLRRLDVPQTRMPRALIEESRSRLFDLREVWLRVMTECRADARRRFDDPE